jgi:hypothetical protein
MISHNFGRSFFAVFPGPISTLHTNGNCERPKSKEAISTYAG